MVSEVSAVHFPNKTQPIEKSLRCLRLEKLKSCLESKPHGDLVKEADYFCDTVKPLMVSLRKAEGLDGWGWGAKRLEKHGKESG